MKLTITEVGVCAFAWGGRKGTVRRGCPESLQEGVKEGEASDGDWEEWSRNNGVFRKGGCCGTCRHSRSAISGDLSTGQSPRGVLGEWLRVAGWGWEVVFE